MYEASFGLKRRPFAATPDATCFLTAGPIQAALDELVICVEQGQGIAVLTAPAGTGKTLLCERLRSELDERFETVLLRHASFLTRRALLQTILCELNYAYHHPSEQELRLELFPAIRALQPKREALVLICDEAHQLTDSLLEELRILADFAEQGRPLVRLVLVGQLSLEEKLAQPSMEAFNQRIRAQVTLSTFDHAGSLDYIDYRLTWAGGRTDEILTPDALDLIARASDGVPRCINQLADHTLLLGFVAEQCPAGEELVREALNDLRQLPLHWNEPSAERPSSSDAPRMTGTLPDPQRLPEIETHGYLTETGAGAAMYSFEPDSEVVGNDSQLSAFSHPSRLAGSDDAESDTQSTDLPPAAFAANRAADLAEFGTQGLTDSSISRRLQFHDLLRDAYAAAKHPIDWDSPSDSNLTASLIHENTIETPSNLPRSQQNSSSESTTSFSSHSAVTQPVTGSGFTEEVIVDRYASIDAGFAPPEVSQPDTTPVSEVRAGSFDDAVYAPSSFGDAGEIEMHPSSDASSFVSNHSLNISDDRQAAFRNLSLDDTVLVHPTSVIAHEIPTRAISTSESAGRSMMAARDESVIRAIWPEADASTLPETSTVEPSVDAHLSSYHDAVSASIAEQVAHQVYSIGESLRPIGILSASSESILKSLRIEVDELASSMAVISNIQPPPVPADASWESVETPEVQAPKAEARPFRYLFSLLRRKQQGLA